MRLWRTIAGAGLILAGAFAVAGCTTTAQELKPTASYIPESEIESANTYRLTPQERIEWQKRIARTDSKAEREFRKLYDFYFPRQKDRVNSFYRRAFDATLFGPPPKPGTDRHPDLYLAFHGSTSAFHMFVHHKDRDGSGEFSETWAVECLVLLLRLGDDGFADLLSSEDKATREIVGRNIDAQVNWQKHSFPKTRACYSFRKDSEVTTEYVRDIDLKHYYGPQIFDLTPRQQRECERRAGEGDIIAAKTLVEYHEMITRDAKQYRHWLKVVERLQGDYLKRQQARRR